jgi:bacterioferritin
VAWSLNPYRLRAQLAPLADERGMVRTARIRTESEKPMKDKSRSIELLNKAVADELQAVHQYMYFHFHLDDQGFAPLALLFKQIAIQEMGHVEILAERILFLGGDVEMGLAGKVEKITDPEKMVTKAAQMEEDSAREYNEWALEANQNADAASKQIFEKLVGDEEGHFDEFDKQQDHIKRFGPSYLALQSFTKTAEGGGGAEG